MAELIYEVSFKGVASATLCGKRFVFYTRPTNSEPRAPQELHAAALQGNGLGPSQVVADATSFLEVSAARAGSGGVVSWIADGRVWAKVVGCT